VNSPNHSPRIVRIRPGVVSLPILVWDGDCGFCRAWVDYWKKLTGDRMAYAPYQEVADYFPDVSRDEFAEAARLFLPDGEMRSGAHAAYTALDVVPGKRWPLWSYNHVPGFALFSETTYHVIAAHRSFFYTVTKLLWGIPVELQQHVLTTQLFVRILGFIYLIAFVSFGVQAAGLIGANGILPIADTIHILRESYGTIRYWLFPTVFWLNARPAAISTTWIAGSVFAVLLMLGVAQRASALASFVIYLSLVVAGGEFMSFQWDALLLEVGLLSVFAGRSRTLVWLYRWLLFRLMFMSGAVKLLSGDPTWRSLTALTYHYQTQPLPTPLAWYMQQLPAWFQKASCAGMFFVELAVPFLIFAPRRLRFLGALLMALLEVLIFLTGNYTFFNLLTMALCLFCLDDARLSSVLPKSFVQRTVRDAKQFTKFVPARKAAIALLVTAVLIASAAELTGRFGWEWEPLAQFAALIAPLRIVNGYGLFAVMTTSRPEIVVEGSNNGATWLEYEFKYKPGNVRRPPAWVEPHQPRLDWEMWFAALGNYRNNPWFVNFMFRLLQGSPDVVALLGDNPFPNAPPRYVRAEVYEYRFTTWEERRQTGAWWHREPRGAYLPAISLESFVPAKR